MQSDHRRKPLKHNGFPTDRPALVGCGGLESTTKLGSPDRIASGGEEVPGRGLVRGAQPEREIPPPQLLAPYRIFELQFTELRRCNLRAKGVTLCRSKDPPREENRT
jgi:hypothetical protein